MIVYKFGGASVKNADGIKKLAQIVKHCPESLIIVISAMDKITNALEKLTELYINHKSHLQNNLNDVLNYHYSICNELFDENNHVFMKLKDLEIKLKEALNEEVSLNFDYEYDKIVSFGELFSTTIIASYLNFIHIENEWVDVRKILKTDSRFRDANVNFKLSEKLVRKKFMNNSNYKIVVTQGFIASNENNINTTLGREGSDYTAALIAYFINADYVVVWKDVPGIMNADPAWLSNAEKIDQLSYLEAIELAYYGAKVIHPKTIKPLQNKNIPFHVKSFLNPEQEGTIIHESGRSDLKPVYILKTNQVLLSIFSADFSFIIEDNLSRIFALFAQFNVKVNLIQNSAISFSVCFSNTEKLPILIKELQKEYKTLYNTNVELITIRHYTQESIERIIGNKKVLLEQKSRNTAQFIV